MLMSKLRLSLWTRFGFVTSSLGVGTRDFGTICENGHDTNNPSYHIYGCLNRTVCYGGTYGKTLCNAGGL